MHILPQLWFRNTWAWGPAPTARPTIRRGPEGPDGPCLVTDDAGVTALATVPVVYHLGRRTLDAPPGGVLLFTDNETNRSRVFDRGDASPQCRTSRMLFTDSSSRVSRASNPLEVGTKAALHYRFDAIAPGGSAVLRLRLSDRGAERPPLSEVDEIIAQRKAEADEFYAAIHPRRR